MTKNHRFAMYQNTIYDDGQIINPFECMKLLNYFYDENIDLVKMNEQLREENKELKSILQDMGLLMSNEEVKNVRNEITSKLIKPLFKGNGFDVDVNTENGFTIIPKGDLND